MRHFTLSLVLLFSGCRGEEASSVSCNSPLAIPHPHAAGSKGCACSDPRAGYCIDGNAFMCHEGQWLLVLDGPCEPYTPSDPAGDCAKFGGTFSTGPTCANGYAERNPAPATGDSGLLGTCCYRIEVLRSNCTAAGYRVFTPRATEVLACKQGTLKAFVIGESGPSLCCS